MAEEISVGHATLQELAWRLRLGETAYRRALDLAGLTPSRSDWLRHIDRFLLALGVLLIVAGVAAFIAWNWTGLGRFGKFGLIEAGLAAGAALAWRFGLDSLPGRIALLAAAFLSGVLLALFGQTYQTGADPYGLFLVWALLILPWCLIGRQAGLWVLLQILLNLGLILYYTQVLHPPQGWWELTQLLGPLVWLGIAVTDSTLAGWLFALNLIGLLLWELGAERGTGWMQGRLFPRLFAFVTLCTVLAPTLVIVVAAGFQEQAHLSPLSPLLLFAATGAALYYYQYRRRDLAILTCVLFSLILVFTAFFIRHAALDAGSLLLIALLVIAQVAGAAWWLRRVAQGWESRT